MRFTTATVVTTAVLLSLFLPPRSAAQFSCSGGVAACTSNSTVLSLGTPASLTLTNATGLPISGVAGLGAGIASFLTTPLANNLHLPMGTATTGSVPGSLPTYVTSWISNSFPGGPTSAVSGTGHWVQDRIWDAFVQPDGTVITNSDFDEQGCEACVYKDGLTIQPTNLGTGGFLHMHGGGGYGVGQVAAIGNIVYLTHQGNIGKFSLTSRDFASPTSDFVSASSGNVTGLCYSAANTEVYASDPAANLIRVYNSTTLVVVTTFAFTAPGKCTVDSSGNVWIIRTSTNAVHKYAHTGGSSILNFTLPGGSGIPSALAIDNVGRLMVGDSGPNQQIVIYNIASTPSVVQTFGTSGGIYSGTSGAIGDLKLISPTGVGTDASGNVFVTSSLGGASIRKFTPAGLLVWHLKNLQFVDGSQADSATDGTDIYTSRGRYTMDYSKSAGGEWAWRAMTINALTYPNDPRIAGPAGDSLGAVVAAVRTVAGVKYLYTTDQYASWIAVYRQSGETFIPSAIISPLDKFTGSGWAAPFPADQAFMWRDTNCDGNMQSGEFYDATGVEFGITSFYVDAVGNIWQSQDNGGIRKYTIQGKDSCGNPIYDRAHLATSASVTAQFTSIKRIQYDSVLDRMYLSGYTSSLTDLDSDLKSAGRRWIRYDSWIGTSNRTPTTTIDLPYPSPTAFGYIASWDVAGGDLFAGILRSRGPAGPCDGGCPADVADQQPHNVYVYDTTSGALLTELLPGPEIGSATSFIDAITGLHAFQRSNGEYLTTVEDEFNGKNILYRMTIPPLGAPGVGGRWSGSPQTCFGTAPFVRCGAVVGATGTDGFVYATWDVPSAIGTVSLIANVEVLGGTGTASLEASTSCVANGATYSDTPTFATLVTGTVASTATGKRTAVTFPSLAFTIGSQCHIRFARRGSTDSYTGAVYFYGASLVY